MVTAVSDLEKIAEPYNRPEYWKGGIDGDGYTGAGYQDFPVHEVKARYLLEMRPQSVLDIGCAFGFMVKRLRAAGVQAYGVDISEYAMSQADESIKPYLQKAWCHELPFEDRSIDVITSFGVLEHLPPELVTKTLQEFKRVARRGVLSITLDSDKQANRKEHPSLHSFRWWRDRLPEGFEIWDDSLENWNSWYAPDIALVAPTIYPTGFGGKYGGIERLVALFAVGLRGHGKNVQVFAPLGSVLPFGAELVVTGAPREDFTEPALMPSIIGRYPRGNYVHVLLDFSHSKPSQYLPRQPSMGPIWHDPMIMQPAQPDHNVIALSRWQADRFRMKYGQDARVLDPHIFDQGFFSFGDEKLVEDRFLYIGKLHPTKGALEAIQLCKKLGKGLDLLGPQTSGDPQAYIDAVLKECDGEQIRYFSQVSAEAKRELFWRCQALIYPVQYPDGQGEAHSHKMAEAIGAGLPCIAYDQGAMSEVIDEGVTGHVVRDSEEFLQAMRDVHKISRAKCRERGVARWSIPAVMSNWLPVISEVCTGDRW